MTSWRVQVMTTVLGPGAAATWTPSAGDPSAQGYPGSLTMCAPVSGLSHSALMPWKEACSRYSFIFLFLTLRTTHPHCPLPGRARFRVSCIFHIDIPSVRKSDVQTLGPQHSHLFLPHNCLCVLNLFLKSAYSPTQSFLI